MTKLLILQPTEKESFESFVEFWARLYYYPLEKLYNSTINKSQFDEVDIQNLFIWKNGMSLSERKQQSVDTKIKAKIDNINLLKGQKTVDLSYFNTLFKDLPAVWKIFLLHTIYPLQFPIYDQHINRAYCFIHGHEFKNISASSMSSKAKEAFYFNTYLDFINKHKHINLKKIDEAMFSFGKFLATNNNLHLLN